MFIRMIMIIIMTFIIHNNNSSRLLYNTILADETTKIL